MKPNIPLGIVTLLFAGFVVLLSGCRNYLVPEVGALSLESDRIDFPEGDDGVALWVGKELDIQYTIAKKSDELVLSGKVIIHESVLRSFDSIDRLAVKLNFLDNSGRVLTTADITPRYSTYNKVTRPLDFKTAVTPDPEASSFVFSYYGTLFGRLADATASWEIFYFPFE